MTNPKHEVLTPNNCQLIFIDHQPQMAFGVQSIDRQASSARADVDELLGRQKVRDALVAAGRKKVIVSGLWTEVCTAWPPRHACRRAIGAHRQTPHRRRACDDGMVPL